MSRTPIPLVQRKPETKLQFHATFSFTILVGQVGRERYEAYFPMQNQPPVKAEGPTMQEAVAGVFEALAVGVREHECNFVEVGMVKA